MSVFIENNMIDKFEHKGPYKSDYEHEWAIFFNELGIDWSYDDENGMFYLPDFHCFMVVVSESVCDISPYQDSECATIVAFGTPINDDMYIFCFETDDGGGGSYVEQVSFGIHPRIGLPYLFAYDDDRERDFYSDEGDGYVRIPMVTTEYGRYSERAFITDEVKLAQVYARSCITAGVYLVRMRP